MLRVATDSGGDRRGAVGCVFPDGLREALPEGLDGEVEMEFFGGPAALGGIIMCVALGAWMLGRWQGGVVPAADAGGSAVEGRLGETLAAEAPQPASPLRRSGAPVIPCQQAAQAERRGALEIAASLGDLHAEVSAYRRAEQVLAGLTQEQLALPSGTAGPRHDCRYLGVMGEPTCAMPTAARRACASGDACNVGRPRAAQPSPVFDLTRV